MNNGIWSFVFGAASEDVWMPEIQEFVVKYDGPALEEHLIDVNELAPALMSLNDLLKEANSIANGDSASVSVKVRATTPGSFEIMIRALHYVDQQVVPALTGNKVTALVNLMALLGVAGGVPGLIWLIQKLKGGQPEKVSVVMEANPDELEIETKEGKFRIGKLTWEFYNSKTVRKSVYGMLKPLEREGVETVEFIDAQKRVTVVSKDDFNSYIPPDEIKQHGLASKKWTPIQAALMVFSFCWFSKATGEM